MPFRRPNSIPGIAIPARVTQNALRRMRNWHREQQFCFHTTIRLTKRLHRPENRRILGKCRYHRTRGNIVHNRRSLSAFVDPQLDLKRLSRFFAYNAGLRERCLVQTEATYPRNKNGYSGACNVEHPMVMKLGPNRRLAAVIWSRPSGPAADHQNCPISQKGT